MKKSEMAEKLRDYYNVQLSDSDFISDYDAHLILDFLVANGMMLPPAVGQYDTVPTVTPTGNLDYSWKREWGKE